MSCFRPSDIHMREKGAPEKPSSYVMQVNSLWPCDAICRHRLGSTLIQVIASCPVTQSHFLNRIDRYWILWHSHETIFPRNTHDINLYDECENCTFQFPASFPRAL